MEAIQSSTETDRAALLLRLAELAREVTAIAEQLGDSVHVAGHVYTNGSPPRPAVDLHGAPWAPVWGWHVLPAPHGNVGDFKVDGVDFKAFCPHGTAKVAS